MKGCGLCNEGSDPLLEIVKSFSTIGPEHPSSPHVSRFRSLLASDRTLGEMQENIGDSLQGHVYASLAARFSRDRGWELKRICWSRQTHDESSASRFRALTVIYSTQSGGIESFTFPEDPRFKGIPCYFREKSVDASGQEAGTTTEVLRYVPGRRLTFRTGGPESRPVTGKFARRSEITRAYERLVQVSAASRRSQSYFSAPSPLTIEENNGLFFQEAKPGTDLTVQLAADNFVDLLHSASQIHQHLHRLPIELPEWNIQCFLENLSAAMEWIKLFEPKQKGFLDHLRDFLVSNCPLAEPMRFAFCHGDFSCRQLLNYAGAWSVVDFDRCTRADPCWEIARFLAFLKYDVPLFRDWFLDEHNRNRSQLEEAHAAYLNGYEQAAGQTLSRKRLLWYRVGAEIQYLARLLTRDLSSSVALERAFELVKDLRAKFGNEKGSWN